MTDTADLGELIEGQAARIKELEDALGLAMRTLADEIRCMQAASIADRLHPGSGMDWINESLCEAMTYPCKDEMWGPHWDLKQSAVDWYEAARAADGEDA